MSTVPTWAAVEKHANERLNATMEALTGAPLDKVLDLQAEVRAWRSVLSLPTTLAPDTRVADAPFTY